MKRSILAIEDSKPFSYLLTTILDKHTVKTVETGFQAMQLLITENETDLILLNIPSANSENFELLEHISTSTLLKDIPVIVLSNSDDTSLKETVIEKGASEFYSKPFDPRVLIEKVDQILNNKPLVTKKKKTVFNLNIF